MSTKSTIVGVLGESKLLLPSLVHEALAANDRAKYYLSLLQLSIAHANDESAGASASAGAADMRREREIAGVADPRLDAVVAGSRRGYDGEYRIPLVRIIVERVLADARAMLAPLRTAPAARGAHAAAPFERRLAELSTACAPLGDAIITTDALARLTASSRERDSLHLLVLDLHKALDDLAASIATEDVEGAKTYDLGPSDRPLVAAFMKGVHRSEAVKFGHPGLGTTATRSGSTLVLENDIGETSAHVLVVHVDGLHVVVTNTDVHLPRIEFLRRMLGGFSVAWTDVRSRSALELPEAGLFYESVGTFVAADAGELERLLAHLGSRLVFLIDWNRARKALRPFVAKKVSLELLAWAAESGCGHRGLLELGGERFVFDTMADVLRTPLRFGERLDEVLGADAAAAFVRFVLRTCSEGLLAGRSRSLIGAEARAELARLVRAGGERAIGPVADHAAIVVELARAVHERLLGAGDGPAVDAGVAARTAKDREHRADELVTLMRGIAARIPDATSLGRVVQLADDAADDLEEAAFLLSLLPEAPSDGVPLADLGGLAVEAAEAYRTAVVSARHADPAGVHALLDAVDAVARLERQSDAAERRVAAALMRDAAVDGKRFFSLSRVAGEIERAVDALTRAALALRDRVT